jgi:hypothetical protein
MRIRPPTLSGVAIGAVVVLIVTATAATAAKLITGADIKDGTIASADLKNEEVKSADINAAAVASAEIKNEEVKSADINGGAVASAELKNNSVASADILDGTIATADLSSAAVNSLKTTYSGPQWSIVDRNVLGNGDSYLRSGPFTPPAGIGSLGIRTGSPDDSAAFGNQVDFFGDFVDELTSVGYSVFTTGENNGRAPNNMPQIKIEIDPNLQAPNPTTSFSTMVYAPTNSFAGVWDAIDADADEGLHWGLTGTAFAGTECDINGPRCTFQQLQGYLDDGDPRARIQTVQIGKGRDFAFSGAVDALIINDQMFDFEPFGVITTTIP